MTRYGDASCPPEPCLEVRAFTHRCVIPITNRLVMWPSGTISVRLGLYLHMGLKGPSHGVFVCAAKADSPQRRMDRVQQRSAGEGLFEERYATLQHFALGYQFTGVT
jgi:hypothetical protein